jgi:flagellar hook-associated protein 1
MSLSGALQIGNSALTASQLAIQIAGNNMANAATPGYSRQIAFLTPARGQTLGRISLGTGVQIADVRRQIDTALQSRLYSGISTEAAAAQQFQILGQVESALGELGENDLSSEFSAFFNSWSERATLVQSSAVVVQQGQRLADFVRRMRSELSDQQSQIDRQLGVQATNADSLLTQIARLNTAVSNAEAGGGSAGALRDQRDQLITQLSQYMDISAVEQNNGAVNILVGSTPVVLGGTSRGVELQRRTENGRIVVGIHAREGGEPLDVREGTVGALLGNRDGAIEETIGKLDAAVAQLIFQTNKLHSTGTNAAGFTSLTGTLSVPTSDRSLALNDPANATFAGLPFRATSGGFTVQILSPTGATQSVRIDIDLDGRDATGAPGFGDDTSLEDIQAQLAGIPGLNASITPEGTLKIDADPGFSYSFSDDSSGVLAVLGVNSYFTGSSASDIAVRQSLVEAPNTLAVGRMTPGGFVENGTALTIASLQDQSLAELGGRSIKSHWIDTAQALGVRTDSAKSSAQSASTVRQSLDAQRASVSGVSMDEESLNLLTYQRQYQGAARFITTVDEMMQILMSMV